MQFYVLVIVHVCVFGSIKQADKAYLAHYNKRQIFLYIWSGKRDSNPRPLPWQGNALPTELFPHVDFDHLRYSK